MIATGKNPCTGCVTRLPGMPCVERETCKRRKQYQFKVKLWKCQDDKRRLLNGYVIGEMGKAKKTAASHRAGWFGFEN